MTQCDGCNKLVSESLICDVCNRELCIDCDSPAFGEFMDKLCCAECGRPIITCTTCALALTPDGEIEKYHLKALQNHVIR